MKHQLTRLFSVLVLVGIVAACGGDPNIESAKLNLRQGNYDQVKSAAEAALVTNPENPLAHYFVGVADTELGRKAPVDRRAEFYRSARESYDRAEQLFAEQEKTGNERDFIPIQIIQVWADEYNSAVNLIVPQEGEATPQGLQRSIHHLNNAFAIEPDSIQTIDILAEVFYMTGDLNQAISSMEQAIVLAGDEQDSFRFLRLNYFHMEAGNREEALEVITRARRIFADDIEVAQELANIYLQMGDLDNALVVVRELIQRNPDNAQYRMVFGTQIYQIVLDMGEDVRQQYDIILEASRDLRTEQRNTRPDASKVAQLTEQITMAEIRIEQLNEQIEDLTQQAEDELLVAAELAPEEDIIFNTLGVIYQNRAAAIFDKRNATEDFDQADVYDRQAREVLAKSLPFYERAAELRPDNTDYWLSLFRIYTTLGMTEKALEAQERSGL
jgi:tetratricopeptide (TPR) repeat protein